MGRRQRRRGRTEGAAATTTDHTDPDGNVLTLRDSVSPGTVAKLKEQAGGAAATVDDVWRRRAEMLFERFAVRWTIAGLPLEGQRELLGRYRMADQDTREWVLHTVTEHARRRHPELG
jgi:hypothetical protein